ncbi:M10 family metallopeptidase [uncultured Tateyamaria sp.]|uniref:M10 family metallopeptidase n=1 Tax=Tateyamaria sp. 1078 TaxID=3417464 RepID=UPI002610BAA1|nr:M10 family metallopeptidase [uncultured Tateyamaria sp.]
MCTICAMTQNFDTTRHEDGGPIFEDGVVVPNGALILEGADAAESSATTYSMSVGDTFQGTLDSAFDEDWIAVDLVAGQSYQISLSGIGSGELSDPYLRVFNASSQLVTFNDDYIGLDSRVTLTATYTGTYYIEADAYSAETGTYSVAITESAPPPPPPPPAGTTGTVEEMGTFLLEGTQGFSRSYDTSVSNQITVDISGLTAAGQQLARWAMDAWEMVANIDFVIQLDGQGNEMITVDDEDSGAFAYYPNSGSTSIADGDNTNGVELNVSRAWLVNSGTTLDSYSFQTYVHEFGHALGLRHQGNYNGTASYPSDAYFTNDSWQMSVMSYFSQTENTSTNASFGYLAGPMMVDIYAIQELYGAPGSSGVTAGNTTYGRGSNLGNYLDEIFTALSTNSSTTNVTGNPMAYTIYDQSGTDTLDLGFLDIFTPARVDLNDGTFSDFGSQIGILGIAVGTIIENLETGAGNDTITGNEANNRLTSGAGNDLILSGAGNDTTSGGSGNDTIYGGGGNDNLSVSSGTNEVFGGAGSDAITGGTGNDVLGGGSGNDTINGLSGSDTLWGSSGNDDIDGGLNNDLVGAGANRDTVDGGQGNDTLYGGGGQDIVDGGDNNDITGGGSGADVVNGGGGDDTVWGQGGNDTVYGGQGNDEVSGGGQGDQLFGQQGNDTLNGGFGNDTLSGGADNDVLNGNFGNDVLTGGLGADIFVFDATGTNTVTDFDIAQGDRLRLDDALWGGGLTAAQVIDQFADDSSGTVVIAVGGATITLEGVSSVIGLDGVLDII